MLSIIIPSRNEPFLYQTICDLLAKAEGEIEIIVNLDGYWEKPVEDPRVHYIHRGKARGMRAGINAAAALARGEILMKIDAHCMVDQGFDVKLTRDLKPDWVVIPRRKRLDAKNWQIKDVGKPDVDYEHLSFPDDPNDFGGASLHGRIWNERIKARADVEIDENMSFQGSCWVMNKEYFKFLELMDEEKYGTFANEAQEIGLKCQLSGGHVMTNKKTWYAHLHKGEEHGRGYPLSKSDLAQAVAQVNKWLTNSSWGPKQTLPLSHLIERFWPVPKWPDNWKELYPQIDKLPAR